MERKNLFQLSDKQILSHIRAAKKLDKIKDETFAFIKKNVESGISEYDVQKFIVKKFKIAELTSGRMRPIVAVDDNSADPHYTPTLKRKNSLIKTGSLIMLDIWAKEKNKDGIYADITWMGYINESDSKNKKALEEKNRLIEYRKIFKIVIGARDNVIEFIENRLKEEKEVEGWEADDVARKYIFEEGYGNFFIHSTGHSLDKNVHGAGISLSSVKRRGHKLARKKDKRKILPNMPFTIEPGIYLENFGVRSEIDAYIDCNNKLIITTEAQKKVLAV